MKTLFEKKCSHFFAKCAVAAIALSFGKSTAFAEVRVGGHAGFESVTAGSDDDYSGFSMGGLVQGAFLSNSSSAVLLGGRLNYINVSGEENSVDYKWSEFLIGAEVGLEYKATPQLAIQSIVGYDLGMSGTYEQKANGEKKEVDTKGIGRIVHDWRMLYAINSNVLIGGNVSWFAGPFKVEKQDDAVSTRGFDIRAIGMYQF